MLSVERFVYAVCGCVLCVVAPMTLGLAAECEEKCRKHNCVSIADFGGTGVACGRYEPWRAHNDMWCKSCHAGQFRNDNNLTSQMYQCGSCDPDCDMDPLLKPQELQGCTDCQLILDGIGSPVTVPRNDCVVPS